MSGRGDRPSFADAPIDAPDERDAGPPAPRRKSGLPDLRVPERNPGVPGFRRGEVHGGRGEVEESP